MRRDTRVGTALAGRMKRDGELEEDSELSTNEL